MSSKISGLLAVMVVLFFSVLVDFLAVLALAGLGLVGLGFLVILATDDKFNNGGENEIKRADVKGHHQTDGDDYQGEFDSFLAGGPDDLFELDPDLF